MKTASTLAAEAREHFKRADDEGRDLTATERQEIEALLDSALEAKRSEELRSKIAAVDPGAAQYVTPGDPNAQVGEGWAQLADAIATKRQRHVEIPTESLLGKAAAIRTKDLTSEGLADGSRAEIPSFSSLGMDSRFLYPRLPIKPVSNELSVSDFRQTGGRSVTGNVLRELTATGTKAELDVEVKYVTTALKQVAITVSGIPNALLDGVGALRAFLSTEASFQLSAAIDSYVISELELSDHPFNAEGSGPIARLRNAVSAHRQLGYNPTVAAVSPTTASELDLTAFDAGYQFNVAAYGSSSPLWNLQIVEVADVVDPLVIDSLALGVLALGPTAIDVDDRSGFTENTSTLRFESSVLLVIRNSEATYEVAIGS